MIERFSKFRERHYSNRSGSENENKQGLFNRLLNVQKSGLRTKSVELFNLVWHWIAEQFDFVISW